MSRTDWQIVGVVLMGVGAVWLAVLALWLAERHRKARANARITARRRDSVRSEWQAARTQLLPPVAEDPPPADEEPEPQPDPDPVVWEPEGKRKPRSPQLARQRRRNDERILQEAAMRPVPGELVPVRVLPGPLRGNPFPMQRPGSGNAEPDRTLDAMDAVISPTGTWAVVGAELTPVQSLAELDAEIAWREDPLGSWLSPPEDDLLPAMLFWDQVDDWMENAKWPVLELTR